MNYKTILPMLRATFSAWEQHQAPRLGASLAFYTILSLAPLVLLVIALVALVIGSSAAQTELLDQVRSMVGQQGADAVKSVIEQAQKPSSSAVASIVGLVTLLIGASGVFAELRAALNEVWEVKPQAQGGIWRMVQQRFFSFGMVLAVGFLLLVSLVVSAGLAVVGKFFGEYLPMPEFALGAINLIISLAGTVALFALIFRFVPEKKIAWKSVWIGSTVTGLLFTIGKFMIGLYLGKSVVASAYGAAGSLVVVIVWVYYSAMIFLFGAEFTHVLETRNYGHASNEAVSPTTVRPGRDSSVASPH